MPGEVVVPPGVLQLKRWEQRARAADAEAARLPPAVAIAIQADVGVVRLVAGNAEDGLELELPPEQAISIAIDLWNAARAATEAKRALLEHAQGDQHARDD